MAITMRRHSLSCSFTYLTLESVVPIPLWEGFNARAARENPTTRRVRRVIYQHLGDMPSVIMNAARQSGLVGEDEIPPLHLPMLQNHQEFR